MLNEKDLRIGNLILFNDDNNTVCAIESIKRDFDDEPYSVEIKFKDGMFSDVNIEDIKPILLTDEWLLRFAVKETPLFFQRVFYADYTDIKYVHQLQNLYFALTGKELTVKEIANAN